LRSARGARSELPLFVPEELESIELPVEPLLLLLPMFEFEP
jgi:hypothetical protein